MIIERQLTNDFNKLLIEVHSTLEDLGDARFERSRQNQFGETALRADIESEEIIIRNLRVNGAPFRVVSEEHGTLDLADKPKFLVVIDGLDGSTKFEETKGSSRAGTMMAMFDKINPRYNDYVYCGIVEHSSSRLLYAAHDQGSRLLDLKSGDLTQVSCSQTTALDENTRMYLDFPYPGTDRLFAGLLTRFNPMPADSTAAAYLDVAIEVADLNLESTRKGNLEVATAFGIINESGGVMVDKKGNSLGTKRYFEFGQHYQLAVITASTPELARKVVNQL